MTERVAANIGVGPFRGTDHYIGTLGDLPQGSANMTAVLLVQLYRLPSANQIPAANGVSAGNPGFRFRITSGGNYDLQVLDGGGTSTVTSGQAVIIGPPVFVIATNDGTTMRMFALGTASSGAGRTPGTPGTFGFAIGASPSPLNQLTVGSVLAFMESDNFLLAQSYFPSYEAQLQNDLRNGRDLTFFRTPVVGEDVYWDARDLYDGSVSPRVTWTDRISSTVLTRQGSDTRLYNVPGGPF